MSATCEEYGSTCIPPARNTVTIDELTVTFCPDCFHTLQSEYQVCGKNRIPATLNATTKNARFLTLCSECGEKAITADRITSGPYAR